MILFRSILLASLCLCSGAAFAVQDCDVGGVPVNPANGSTTAGKSGIMRCRERDSGQLQREQELRDGRFVGLVRYYKDGRLEKEFSVNEQGNRDGRGREFSTVTGKVIREDSSNNGTIVGLSRSFHPDGQPRRIAYRDEAGKEQAAVEYTARGQLRELRCGDKPWLGKEADEAALCGFAQRGKVAVAALYGDKGELRARVSHLDGVRVATETFWGNGKPRSQEETAADGRQVERSFAEDGVKRTEVGWIKAERGRFKEYELEYHDSGALLREQRWSQGAAVSDKGFYLNGQPRRETLYTRQDGVPASEVKEFHDNGKLASQGRFAGQDRYRQRPVGEHLRYDSEARLRQVRSYDAQGRLGREQEFDEQGKVVRDDQVFEDGSRKAYAAPAQR